MLATNEDKDRPETERVTYGINSCCMGFRKSGKDILRGVIEQHHRRIKELQTLHDMLPERPTPDQDHAIWSLAHKLAVNI